MSNIKDFEIEDGVLEAYHGAGGAIRIPDGVTAIADEAFWLCTAMTSVTIPDSVREIGSGAFEGCTGLTALTIPKSVTDIAEEAFCYCTGLASITVASGNPVYHSAGNCLIKTKAKTVIQGCNQSVIPADGSVTAIADEAFFGCIGLTEVRIPATVTRIGEGAFACCTGLTSLTVERGNPVYHSADNCLIETATKTLVQGCTPSIIPRDGSVTAIGDGAFRGFMGLGSISLPASVTGIGDGAFKGCTDLFSVELPTSVKSIGWEAFAHCTALTAVLFPAGMTSIGDEAFSGCTALTAIMIPESMEYIGEWAFYHCEKLLGIYYVGSEQAWERIEKPEDLFPDGAKLRFDCKPKKA